MAKGITEEQYQSLSYSEKSNYVKEWNCTCNECGKKWHYLDSVEKEMDRQILSNSLVGMGNCCNPCITTATTNASTQLNKQIKELKQCPKCGSSNVKREAKYFKK